MKKRLFTLILACLTLLTLLVGCADGEAGDDTGGENPQSEATNAPLVIVSEGKSEYIIVRSSTASDEERDAATRLRKAIEEKCGVRLEITDEDFCEGKKSIFVGDVPVEAVDSVTYELGYSESIIAVSGTDVIICGGHEAKTAETVDKFIEKYLSAPIETLTLAGDLFIKEENPDKVKVKVGDTSICDYNIVIGDFVEYGIKYEAEALRQALIDRFDINLAIRKESSKSAEKEILIGNLSSRKGSDGLKSMVASCGDNNGLVYFDGGKIWLTGNNDAAIRDAVYTFIEDYMNVDRVENGVLELPIENGHVNAVGSEYTVMSFNVMNDRGEAGDALAARRNAVITHIREASPDILGVQECTVSWFEYLSTQLESNYAGVGELNYDVQKWRNAIFYRKDKFELLETKTLWLTDTPEVMSRADEEGQYRILTYAILRDKQTGKTLVHCNTHMGFTEIEREVQFRVLVEQIAKLNYPLLLTGDFNLKLDTAQVQKIVEAGYVSAFNLTKDNDEQPSYRGGTGQIDHCFCTADTINVISHEYLGGTVNNVEPSDHKALVVRFRLR